ncbi:MAG: hypothetical protein NTW21_31850 [Verrucomicrobia bacterium]|nr:hypothetical protein [Verrucomicrobiota bacterium]
MNHPIHTLLLAIAAAAFPLKPCPAQEAQPTAPAPLGFECRKIDKPFVHIPIKNGAPKVRLLVKVDGEVQHGMDVELAQDQADWNGTLSVQKWLGKKLSIVPENPLPASGWIHHMKMSDQLSDQDSVYKEKYRPQFHFATRRGWINDPNGPIYLNGEYPGNPVIPYVAGCNRDGKMVWYEDKANPANSHWAAVLLLDGSNSSLWTSKNLIHWERTQALDNIDVCPDCADIYQIPLDGDPGKMKWVLWFGDGNYNVGTFDGKNFKNETGTIKSKTERTPGDRDRNDHTAQTFSNMPAADGRRIQIGWVLGDRKTPQFVGMPFTQQYPLPRVLTLRTTPDGPRLFFEPAKEIEKLRTGVTAQMQMTPLDGTAMPLKEDQPLGELVEVNAVFTIHKEVMTQPGENIVGLEINGQKVTCDLAKDQMIGNDGYQPLKVIDGQLKLRLFVDRTVVESFAAGVPWAPLSYPFMPADKPTYTVKVFGKKDLAEVELNAWQLQSIWKK